MIGVRKIRRAVRAARFGRPLPLIMRSRRVRRFALRDIALHGDHVTVAQVIETTDDLLAWSGEDAIVPVDVNGVVARRGLPQARFVVLLGVEHVPMIDNPETVARTILETAAAVDQRTEHA
jgi:pimeloyl-ACP methyl ester carboxylesterase